MDSHPTAKKLHYDADGELDDVQRHGYEIVNESQRSYAQTVGNENSENRKRTKSAESAAARFKPQDG